MVKVVMKWFISLEEYLSIIATRWSITVLNNCKGSLKGANVPEPESKRRIQLQMGKGGWLSEFGFVFILFDYQNGGIYTTQQV